jgi:hypothetical protein
MFLGFTFCFWFAFFVLRLLFVDLSLCHAQPKTLLWMRAVWVWGVLVLALSALCTASAVESSDAAEAEGEAEMELELLSDALSADHSDNELSLSLEEAEQMMGTQSCEYMVGHSVMKGSCAISPEACSKVGRCLTHTHTH